MKKIGKTAWVISSSGLFLNIFDNIEQARAYIENFEEEDIKKIELTEYISLQEAKDVMIDYMTRLTVLNLFEEFDSWCDAVEESFDDLVEF